MSCFSCPDLEHARGHILQIYDPHTSLPLSFQLTSHFFLSICSYPSTLLFQIYQFLLHTCLGRLGKYGFSIFIYSYNPLFLDQHPLSIIVSLMLTMLRVGKNEYLDIDAFRKDMHMSPVSFSSSSIVHIANKKRKPTEIIQATYISPKAELYSEVWELLHTLNHNHRLDKFMKMADSTSTSNFFINSPMVLDFLTCYLLYVPHNPHLPRISYDSHYDRELKRILKMLSTHQSPERTWSEIYIEYDTLVGLSFPISSLICGRFRLSFPEFLSTVSRAMRSPTPKQPSTHLSLQIADAMVRVAVTRIFADPSQSIMEIPVNSIDSYRRMRLGPDTPSIGKFGMGFFSFLYWLVGHPKRYITIKSRRQNTRWSLKIQEIQGVLTASFQKVTNDNTRHGTQIDLFAVHDNFSNQEVQNFKKQIARLDHIEDITLHGINPDVLLSISNTHIGCYDNAEGISLEVLLSSMLIPSISTKKSTAQLPFSNKSRVGPAGGGIEILVGGIVVVSNLVYSSWEYIVDMPLDTPLPVSRDDIIIEPYGPTYHNLFHSLSLILEQCINATQFDTDLEDFIENIRVYALYSGQKSIYIILDQLIENIKTRQDLVLIPSKRVVNLLKKHLSVKIANFRGANLSESQRRLRPYLSGVDIFQDVLIVPLDDPDLKPTMADIPSYIFVSSSLLEDPDWVDRLVEQWDRTILVRKGETHPSLNFKIINQENYLYFYTVHIFHLPLNDDLQKTLLISRQESDYLNKNYYQELKNLYYIVLSKISSFGSSIRISINFEFYDKRNEPYYIMLIIYKAILLFISVADSNDQVLEYITQIGNAISNIKVNLQYGANVIINFNRDIIEVKPVEISEPKMRRMTREAFLASLHNNTGHQGYLKRNIFYITENVLLPHPNIDAFLVIFGLSVDSLIVNYIYQISDTTFEANKMIDILCKTCLLEGNPDGILTRERTVDFLLTEIRHSFGISYMKEYMEIRVDLIREYDVTFYEPLIQSMRLYLDIAKHNLPTKCKIKTLKPKSVLLSSQLVDFVFHSDSRPPQNRREFNGFWEAARAHRIHLASERPQFQSIRIAVNEGTNKPFVHSVLTELLQNSIDAIRKSIAMDIEVSERIKIKLCTEYLEVRDYVGIPDSAFLSLLIPFLSSKKVGEMMSTGEMGTGFFNVYRQPYVELVYIKTRDIIFYAKPLVSEGRVVDIEYAKFRKKEFLQGTQVVIKFRQGLSINQIIDFKVDVGYFVNNTLAYLKYPIYYNKLLITKSTKIVYSSHILTASVMSGIGASSLLLTNGIPLGELNPFLAGLFGWVNNNNLNMGLVVDIDKRYYRPVHSRNRLAVGEVQDSGELKTEMVRALFYFMANKLTDIYEDSMLLDIYLPNATSKQSLSQYFPYRGNNMYLVGDIKFMEVDEPMGWGLLLAINKVIEIYRELGLDVNEKNTEMIMVDRMNIGKDERGPYALIRRWFRDKRKFGAGPRVSQRVIIKSDKDRYDKGLYDDVRKVLVTFTNSWYKTGARLGITRGADFNRGPPKISFGVLEGSTLANYSSTTHKIKINMVGLSGWDITNFMRQWDTFVSEYKKNPISANYYLKLKALELKKMLGNTFPGSSLLVHELVHSVSGTSHTDPVEPHGEREMIIKGESKILSFQEVCKTIYDGCLLQGLWQEVTSHF